MNRRGFLKLGLTALGAAAVAPCLPPAAKLAIESCSSYPVPVELGEMRGNSTVDYVEAGRVKRVSGVARYSFDDKTGVYTFDPADAGKLVTFTYNYAPFGK